jgi:hypothetical protein
MIILSNKYPDRGKMRAISDNPIVKEPKIRLDRRNHLGKPVFISPSKK